MKNQLKTVVLLGLLTGLLLWIGSFWGQNGLLLALVFSIFMNFITYWFSDKIVLMMYRAKPLTSHDAPGIYSLVKNAAKKAKLPIPKVYQIPTETPNAFATGRNPKHAAVAVTKGIVKLLTKEELEGVIAHELAHIKNRDTLIQAVAATIAGVISYAAYMARFAAIFGGSRDRDSGNLFELLALTIITPILAMIIQLAISRSREYIADETGARIAGNPAPLASALHKLDLGVKNNPLRFGNPSTSSLFIVNPFSAAGVLNLLSTHPPVEERIKRLNNLKI